MQPETEIQTNKSDERRNSSWDLRNAFGNYAMLVISQVAVAFFSFASVTLCTRTLGAEGYGGIVAIIAASSVAQIFVNWSCIGLARFGVEEFVESGKISKSFWARTIIFLPNILIFLAFSFAWYPILANWLKLPNEAFWLVILHFIVSATWLHVQYTLHGAKLPKMVGLLLATERFLIFFTLVVLSFTENFNWLLATWAYILPSFLMILVGLWQIRNLYSWKLRLDTNYLKLMLKFSIPLIPFSLIGYFSTNYLDAIFISQYLSKAELGIYQVAYQINGILMQFPTLAGSLLLPMFVTFKTNDKEYLIEEFFKNLLPFFTLFWGIICIFGIVSISMIFPFIFGDKFTESIELLFILSISSISAFIYLAGYSPLLNTFSLPMLISFGAIINSFCNVLFNYLLIPKYGLKGCAVSTALAYLTTVVGVFFALRFKTNFKKNWSLQATLPPIIFILVREVTNNLLISSSLFLLAILVLCIFYIKSIKQFTVIIKQFVAFNN